MKEQYMTPDAEFIMIESEDIMTASSGKEDWELDIIPADNP